MSLSAKFRRAPLRLAAGAYILNSGVTTLKADDETAKSLHGMASGMYPVLGKLEPKVFARTLAAGEIAVGSMLLLPIVPPFIAGAALVGFSGAQLNMYWHTPGMHHEGSLRPTPQGTPISEAVWMLGIGVGLMTDATLEGAREGVEEIEAPVARRRVEWGERARRLVRRARRAQTTGAESVEHLTQHTGDASEATSKRLAETRAEYGPMAAETARTAGERYGTPPQSTHRWPPRRRARQPRRYDTPPRNTDRWPPRGRARQPRRFGTPPRNTDLPPPRR
jgi:hypothetical protein